MVEKNFCRLSTPTFIRALLAVMARRRLLVWPLLLGQCADGAGEGLDEQGDQEEDIELGIGHFRMKEARPLLIKTGCP